ncbi:hypothetical protein AGATL06_19670 [Agathobaculum sp. TL06]|uniref:helix-turn-helix domain-containing protein n=1 Tax=Agathobaculum TaxID=2048137 RepID=UPI0027D7D2AE|nr:helix-turn-helix domain-containing protein [Agathobaculum massiliense]
MQFYVWCYNDKKGGECLPICYNKLFATIKQRGKTEYYLRKNGISPSILSKLKNGTGGIDARTIEKLCKLLDCQPGDLMEYKESPQSSD